VSSTSIASQTPTRETPFVRESGALCRFDWVNYAALSIEENTTAVSPILQG